MVGVVGKAAVVASALVLVDIVQYAGPVGVSPQSVDGHPDCFVGCEVSVVG